MLFNRDDLASSSSELDESSGGAGKERSTVLRILSTAEDELVKFSALRFSNAARTLRSRVSSTRILSVGVCLGFFPDSYEHTCHCQSDPFCTGKQGTHVWLTILGESAVLAWPRAITLYFS